MRAANPLDIQTLAFRGLGALVIAIVVNFSLAWVMLSQNLVESTEFLQYPGIAFWTVLGMSGATVVYGVLTRRSATPDRTFVRIAAIVLLLSFIPDIGLAIVVEGVTTSEAIGLMILHVPPAMIAVMALPEHPFGQ